MVTSTPADASTQRELRMRAAVMAPRQTLPSKQRRLKGGTTSFMVAIHVLATVALLPRFWSWQGLVAFAVDGTSGAAIELNAETDFVSRNET